MDIERIKQTFFVECAEQLAEVEEQMLALRAGSAGPDAVHAIFRAVHSIKGGAGAFGFAELVAFAHVIENGLDVLRNRTAAARDPRLDLIARAADLLTDAVAATRDGMAFPATHGIVKEITIAFALEDAGGVLHAGKAGPAETGSPGPAFEAVPIDLSEIAMPTPQPTRLMLHPTQALYDRGNDVQLLVRNLGELGPVTARCLIDELPPLDVSGGTPGHPAVEVTFAGPVSEAAIADVFEWSGEDCSYEITAGDSPAALEQIDFDAILASLDEAVTAEPGSPLPAGHFAPVEPAAPIVETAVAAAPGQAAPPTLPGNSPDTGHAKQKAQATIRVDSEKVDRLINLMGEAVIAQAMLAARIGDLPHASSGGSSLLGEMQALMREIQEGVMAIRAQPVKPVFMRMARVIREAGGATGKKVNLELAGEATEVDTTVIENLSDPLTHMIRNAIDHGIEAPEKRLALGKPETGTIRLSAQHASGRILVTIEDDGAGINRPVVLRKAIERGLVDPNASLSPAEIDNLIFAPGFSTAEKVTDLSGRGVGMDVVRQAVQALGGRISIQSSPGEGTQMRLSLPLTLAILDGMIVRAGGEVLVVPLTSVVETLGVKSEDIRMIGRDPVLRIRDAILPVIDVAACLGFSNGTPRGGAQTVIVVEGQEHASAALLIDAIEGQQQIVIKSLEGNFQRVPFVAAATILGTGRIALILDIDDIISKSAAKPFAAALPERELAA